MDLQSDLTRAVQEGNDGAIIWLLSEGHKPVRQRDGRTLLHLAIQNGLSTKTFKKLLRRVDVTLRDINFKSILNLLDGNSYKESICDYIREIVSDGRTEDIKDMMLAGWNFWPCDISDQLGVDEKVKTLFSNYKEMQMSIEAIHTAAAEGNGRVLFRLLAQKQNLVRYRDVSGTSILHKAVVFEQTETVRYIVEYFSELIHVTDDMNLTPLHYATGLCDEGLIYDILIKAGSDDQAPDLSGYTPAYYMSEPSLFSLSQVRNLISKNMHHLPQRRTFLFLKDVPETHDEESPDGDVTSQPEDAFDSEKRDEIVDKTPDGIGKDERNVQLDARSDTNGPNGGNGEREVGCTTVETSVGTMIGRGDAESAPGSELNNSEGSSLMTINVTDDEKVGSDTDGRNNKTVTLQKYERAIYGDDYFANSRLYSAIIKSDTEKFRALLDEDTEDIHGKSLLDASTYLHLAVTCHAGVDVVREIVARVNVSLRNISGQTALDVASMSPLTNICAIHEIHAFVEKLIANDDIIAMRELAINGWNAWPNVPDQSMVSTRTWQFLQSVPVFHDKVEQIHKCVSIGNIRTLRQLVTRRGLALAKDATGLSPLHKAIIYGSTSIVRFLIQSTPEVLSSTDQCGRTALHYAAVSEDKGHLFAILHKSGADSSARDMFGCIAHDYFKNQMKFVRQMTQQKISSIRKQKRSALPWNFGENVEGLKVSIQEDIKNSNKTTTKSHAVLPKLEMKTSKVRNMNQQNRNKKVLSMLQLNNVYAQRKVAKETNEWNDDARKVGSKPNGSKLEKIKARGGWNKNLEYSNSKIIEMEIKKIKAQANMKVKLRRKRGVQYSML